MCQSYYIRVFDGDGKELENEAQYLDTLRNLNDSPVCLCSMEPPIHENGRELSLHLRKQFCDIIINKLQLIPYGTVEIAKEI